jgi:hypothetical protein
MEKNNDQFNFVTEQALSSIVCVRVRLLVSLTRVITPNRKIVMWQKQINARPRHAAAI